MLIWLLTLSTASAVTLRVDPSDATAHPDLDSAVAAAQSGDTIELSAGTHTACVSAEALNLTITGAGPAATTLALSSGCDILLAWTLGQLVLSDLSIDASEGLALYTQGTTVDARNLWVDGQNAGAGCFNAVGGRFDGHGLLIENCGNGSGMGGAIAITESTLHLTESVLRGNEAGNGGAVSSGGCSSFSSITLEGVVFEDNVARVDGGAIYGSSTFVESTNSRYIDNTAIEGSGGAVAYVTLSSEGDTFLGNTAGEWGGAVGYAPVEMTDAWLADNTATHGGAIGASYAHEVRVSGATLNHNTATTAGGAIAVVGTPLELSDAVLCGNSAAIGGALWSERHLGATLSHLQLVNNTAQLRGGALFINVTGSASESSTTTALIQSTVAGNVAPASAESLALMGGHLELHNTLVSHTQGAAGVHLSRLLSADLQHNGWFDNPSGHGIGDLPLDLSANGQVEADPAYAAFSTAADCSDLNLRLHVDSPMRDAGHPDYRDLDGSAADIGAFGGEGARVEDHDGDGYTTEVDCVDTDDSVFPGAEEVDGDGIDQDCDGLDGVADEEEDDDGSSSGDTAEPDDSGDDGVDATGSPSDDEAPSTTGDDSDRKSGGCAQAAAPVAGGLLPLSMLLAFRRRDGQ